MIEPLYHLATREDWNVRSTTYVPAPFASEGFIHLSTGPQIAGVAARFYRNRDDLLLLTIDPQRLEAPVRYENLEGGDTLFPHLYGPLELGAVLAIEPVHVDAGGRIRNAGGHPLHSDGRDGAGKRQWP